MFLFNVIEQISPIDQPVNRSGHGVTEKKTEEQGDVISSNGVLSAGKIGLL